MVLVCPADTAETRHTQEMECVFGLFLIMEHGISGLQPIWSWDSCFTLHLRMHCVHFWRRFLFAPSCVLLSQYVWEKKNVPFLLLPCPTFHSKQTKRDPLCWRRGSTTTLKYINRIFFISKQKRSLRPVMKIRLFDIFPAAGRVQRALRRRAARPGPRLPLTDSRASQSRAALPP